MKGEIFFPYGIVRPSTIPDVADAILDEFFAVAKELKIKACVAFGLCLGLYRNGGYIEDDNDLDVVVIAPERDKILTDALIKHGFGVGAFHPGLACNTHFYKNKILLDIFWRQTGIYFDPKKYDMISYKGKKYPAPHPIEKFLSECYADWKTPSDEMTKYYG
ncbi:MAG: hypothetical protein PHG61_05665 [Candidatus Marinimicrobia bacterium]|nr:hypothetical protein [Candidatus Neomarinimicrobiota bacterium]